MIAVRVVVRGRVQGVGFRLTAAATARTLALVGWVRNLPDGSVETLAQGPEDAVDFYKKWLSVGPRAATVVRIEETLLPADPSLASFEVR